MRVLTNINSLNQLLESSRNSNKSIGFVPTMGALHEGHLSLVKLAQKDCDVVVCSIFINPTQFNDSNDLENFPITIEEDIKLLEEQSCDILFQPNVTEMYPKGLNTRKYSLNGIDKVLEGKKRPGHFDGVCTIVYRLFSIVKPNTAYFGEKDFQQVAIIRQMVNNLDWLPVHSRALRADAADPPGCLTRDSQVVSLEIPRFLAHFFVKKFRKNGKNRFFGLPGPK